MANTCMCMKGLTSTAVVLIFEETSFFWGNKCGCSSGEWITSQILLRLVFITWDDGVGKLQLCMKKTHLVDF